MHINAFLRDITCASVYSVTDELEQSPGFPYSSLAVKSRRPSPVEPINLTYVFSVCRYAARRPSPLILSVFNWPFPARAGRTSYVHAPRELAYFLT